VSLFFLQLKNVDVAINRVATRVIQGGHFIAEDVIKRRYHNGWINFQNLYAPMVDTWAVYDNNNEQPVLIEWSEKHEGR